MKYFLDSGKIDEIKYAYENWAIDGVTTNPRHILTAGKPFFTVIKEIATAFKDVEFPISVEINPHLQKPDEMIAEATKIAALDSNFVIKIPCTESGLVAAKKLAEKKVKVNVTLVFTVSQAIQAGRIGARFVSPFIGWQESAGVDCFPMLAAMADIYNAYGFDTEIIAAAIRTGKQIADAATLGVDIVTAGMDVYKESFLHPFTDKGLQIFKDAWDKTELGKW